ncbi:MAG: DMT family transporter [Nitrospira sp.]
MLLVADHGARHNRALRMSQASHVRFWAIPSLLFAAAMWGLIWYPYRLLQDAGSGGVATTFLTSLIPLVMTLTFTWRHLLTARAHLVWLAVMALAAGWANMAFVLAVIEGEVMRVVLLFYLAPVWTVFFARALLGEMLTLCGWAIMVFSFAGALVMLWPADGGLPLPNNHAEWIALSAGVSFALANVITRKIDKADHWAKALAVWAGVCVVAGIATKFVAQPFAFLATINTHTVLMLLGVGLCTGAMTLAVQYGLSHTLANQAIIIFLFELVVAALSSWWWANETLNLQEWMGAAMIITSSLFSGRLERPPIIEKSQTS